MKEIIDDILRDYKFIGDSFDKDGKFVGNYYLYSKTIFLFPSQVRELKGVTNFTISHLYSGWYIIGFNKKS